MNTPTPAIVSERSAERLPRLVLLMLCIAYVAPGVFGRDPWRNADLSAFGFMASVATGAAPWWQPAIAGVPAEGGPLPYWLGAIAIRLLPFLDAAVAARLPYAMVLAGVLVLVWYAAFHLARTDAAQPIAFAFGGEAHLVDYARALADGALLALITTLGLLPLGHETTPELLQLLAASCYLYGLAAAPFRPGRSRLAVFASLPLLAASGAPSVALWLGALGLLLAHRSSYEAARRLRAWLLASMATAVLAAWLFDAWAWRLRPLADLPALLNLVAWFTWPVLPMSLWALWRWRSHHLRRHITIPLVCALVPLGACVAMNGADRALLLALPALAVLAAFALPTLQRGIAAAVDWFSVLFFSAFVLFVWIYYLSMQTGWPAQPLANVRKLAVGFEPSFQLLPLLLGAAGTLAWLALVRWRTARHRHAIWKSLALPAGGVAAVWLLAMTLLLAPLDYARSLTPLLARLRPHLPLDAACVAGRGLSLPTLAALQFQGGWHMEARSDLASSQCPFAVQQSGQNVPGGWVLVAEVRRPTDRSGAQALSVLRRP